MCEFCLKHGEGKKWYLEASNYAEELLSDLGRQKLFESFNNGLNKEDENLLQKFDDLDKAPAIVKRFICRSVCEKEAIHLMDRAQVPVAARVWH